MNFIIYLIKWLVIMAFLIGAGIFAFVQFHPVFGGKPDADTMARMQKSPQFEAVNGIFVNLEKTEVGPMEGSHVEKPSILNWAISMVNPPKGKIPTEPLPTIKLDPTQITDNSFTWLGHSTVIFKTAGKTFVTDPVYYRASPIFIGGKPFAMTNTPTTDELPPIDVVLLSHDHYDHLDYQAIKEIDHKVGHYFAPLGVKAHLVRWGVKAEKVTELDWHESVKTGEVNLTLAPTRHFTGRSLSNRNGTLWGSWVIKSPNLSLFFSGDSGYGKHFKAIGEQYGPFDFAFMENGAYNEQWAMIHMFPEQSVQASLDIGAKAVLPIHWGKFDLAYHLWRDPIQRFLKASEQTDLRVTTPKIGQTFTLDNLPQEDWWSAVK